MSAAVHADEHYIVYEVGPGKFEVAKIIKGDDGEWGEWTRYEVTPGFCSCKSFGFRRDCKHVHYVREDSLQTRPVDLDEARKIVRSVLQHLEGCFSWIGLEDDEPYQRDPNGKIIGVRMVCKWDSIKGHPPIRMYVLADGLLIRLRLAAKIGS
jgi:hypothetical protein